MKAKAAGDSGAAVAVQGVKAKGKAPPPEPVKEGPSVDELNQRIAELEAEKKREEELRNYMQLERASSPVAPCDRLPSLQGRTCSIALQGPTLLSCTPAACRGRHSCPGNPVGPHGTNSCTGVAYLLAGAAHSRKPLRRTPHAGLHAAGHARWRPCTARRLMLALHAQDKIATFWEIGKREAEDRRADLRNKDREMEELEERHQVEIKVRPPLWSLRDTAVHGSRGAWGMAGRTGCRTCV